MTVRELQNFGKQSSWASERPLADPVAIRGYSVDDRNFACKDRA